MIALVQAYRNGRLQRSVWLPNLISGLIVGIVALPLAMAFAIASGARPEQGLYTAIIGGFLVSVFGGSQLQIAGPTGAFIVILAGITAKFGIEGLQIATLMAGCLLLLMGLLRLGKVIRFIPESVIIGFTSGIAVIIFVGQWKDFFGLTNLEPAFHFYDKLIVLIKALPHLNPTTTALSVLTLSILVIWPRFIKRIPAPLVAMIVLTTLELIFHFKEVATIGSTFGGIPQLLPHFHLPNFSAVNWVDLIGPAFSIAFLAAIESLLCALVADKMAGTRHHSNQELIGQGLANIAAPLFGGFATSGAIARTATNIRNGGNSPIAGIIHCLTLLLVILVFAPLTAYIPLCVLAAILFVVAYNISELPRFSAILRSGQMQEVVVLMLTFLLTIFSNLIVAVALGVLASFLLRPFYAKAARVEE